MKKSFLLLLMVCCSVLFFQCKYGKSHNTESELSELNNVENEDGIRAAQEMEFERTKDKSLGYIPNNRLISAIETLRLQRENGTSPNGTLSPLALSWTERGSNSDAVGPSNVNGRVSGTQVTSGRIRTILFDNADATNHTIWIGGVDGGLWKTTDITATPATWTLVNDFFANLAIGSICQNPSNGNIMYFGTGERAFNVDAVRGGGIWKSTDHGVTWALLPSTTGFWNVSKMVCDVAGNVYVATIGGGNGLQRSTDGGTTWTNITPTTAGGGTRISEMELSSTGRLHVVKGYYNSTATQCGYFFTDAPSTVAAGTWTTPTTPFTPAIQYNCDLTSAGATLYALPASSAFQTNQVWKSTDGGDNWAITTTTPTIGGSAPVSSGQAWYNLAIAVDPSNANRVMVGGLNSYISTDGGATWSVNSVWVTGVPGSTNYIHADHQVLTWSNNGIVLDGGDGGIFYSGNNGSTFADRNVNLRLKQFYACAIHPTSTNYFLAGAQDNGCHQLNGAGLTSSVEVTGGDGAYVHIDEDEPAFQFGSYVYNQYRRSTNSGAAWSSFNYSASAGQFINPTDYDDINNKLYGAWTAGNFFRWNDPTGAGGSGSSIAVASFGGLLVSHTYVSKYTTNRVFFGTDGGKIVKTDNANATPTATDITGSGMSATSVSCITQGTDENNLLATFSNYGSIHVWATTTGGGAAAWTNISGNLPDIPVRWAMYYPEDNTKAILATEMGIYETALINGASTVWIQTSTFPAVRTDMLQYRFRDNTVAAATHGRGLWTASLTPAQPYVRFTSSYTYSKVYTEATAATTGCRNYTDYTLNMHIDNAPVGAANVTLSIAGGATATQGIDYDFTTNGNFAVPSTVITFPNGSTADQPITIRVYDDAEVESVTPEFFTFNYSIGGGTNAVAAPSSSSYTVYMGDNDVAPTATAIETVLNNNKTEHIGNNGTYYFYSSGAGRLMNSISGSTGSLACVSSNVFEAGITWQPFTGGERSQKVIEVIPTTNTGSSYTISLYYTAAELAGKTPSTLRIAKTTAATLAAANATNTVIATTGFAAYNGTDYVFTASFTGFSKFFLVDNTVTLPVDLLSFSGYLNNQDHSLLQWQTTNQFNLDRFEVERSYDGIQFSTAGIVNATPNTATVQTYLYTDPSTAKAVNYYRLKMIDKDARLKLSGIVIIKSNKPVKFVELLGNPIKDNISFVINNKNKDNVSAALYNSAGQLVKQWLLGKIDGNVLLPLNTNVPAGIFSLRISAGSKTETIQLKK
jgi:trimeric autotransporter adhesin